jgi:hypothetical protein
MTAVVARLVTVPIVLVSLLSGIAGGLMRAGVALPEEVSGSWLGHAVVAHAFLMICAFMGTVIGIERAVAVKQRWAFIAPALTALAGVAAVFGFATMAAWLGVTGAAVFVAVNVLVVMRQQAAHTTLLWVGSAAWFVGSLAHASAASPHAVVPWWLTFLVLTIAAERLEMTRLMRRRAGAQPTLCIVLAALFGGCGAFPSSPLWGGLLYGAALTGLAVWLLSFDIARRTVWAHGLSRYMAVCLLLGYFWLAIAGMAWCATALGPPLMDAAIHALALGFVFSMMLAHAPVILPAVARIKLLFGWPFYLPLALLHGSLAVRLLRNPDDLDFLAAGAAGNAAAIVLFIGTVAGAAIVWRRRHPRTTKPHAHAIAAHR